MGQREQLQKRIDSKLKEIEELESKIRDGQVYVSAMQEAMKFIPRDADEDASGDNAVKSVTLRHGSSLAQARDAILRAGKPLHISEILQAIGKPNDKKNRISLSGSIASYVRSGVIFTRPRPNTFGLTELDCAAGEGEVKGLEFDPEEGEKRRALAN